MAELVHFCHYEWLKQTGHFPADGNLQVAIRTPNLRKRPGGGAEGNDARRITIDPQPPPLAHDRLLNPRNGPAVPVRGGQDVNSPEKGIPADLSSDPAPTDDPPPPTSASSPRHHTALTGSPLPRTPSSASAPTASYTSSTNATAPLTSSAIGSPVSPASATTPASPISIIGSVLTTLSCPFQPLASFHFFPFG